MEWKKVPEELVQFLAEKMKNVKCEYRKMFGYPAYFINGSMFAGIQGETLFLSYLSLTSRKSSKPTAVCSLRAYAWTTHEGVRRSF